MEIKMIDGKVENIVNDAKLMIGQVKRAKKVYIYMVTGAEFADGLNIKAIKAEVIYLIENYPTEFDIDKFRFDDEGILYIN
jgi:hypothetical protein